MQWKSSGKKHEGENKVKSEGDLKDRGEKGSFKNKFSNAYDKKTSADL